MAIKKIIINWEEQVIPTWVKTINWMRWNIDFVWVNWINIMPDDDAQIKIRWTVYNAGPLVNMASMPYYRNFMKWPCDDWFCIGNMYSRQRINTWWTTMWARSASDHSPMATYLKLPFAWLLWCNWALTMSSNAIYRTAWSRGDWYAEVVNIEQSSFNSNYTFAKTCATLIRPFAIEAVAPDNTWTTLFDGSSTATGAWIFHNATLWLISISKDWTDWITIADKNVWATTVYNSWDTMSQSNRWKFFQRGNNYGFPSGSNNFEKTSTKVDTSWYWPLRPYYWRVFITWSTQDWDRDWSTVENGDLRWYLSYDDWSSKSNVISCNWVSSVNGKTWAVQLNSSAIVSPKAPNDIEPWLLWYDTTNSVLKIYDGSQWQTV